MSETYYACACGFKCTESQLAKTYGACPRCGKRTATMKAKYGESALEETNFAKISRGEM